VTAYKNLVHVERDFRPSRSTTSTYVRSTTDSKAASAATCSS